MATNDKFDRDLTADDLKGLGDVQGLAASLRGAVASFRGAGASLRDSVGSMRGAAASHKGIASSLRGAAASMRPAVGSLRGLPPAPEGTRNLYGHANLVALPHVRDATAPSPDQKGAYVGGRNPTRS